MNIAVVGSFSDEADDRWPLQGTFDEFRIACESLGALLAKQGHELSVQHDRIEAADRHIVQGYLDRALRDRSPSQRITVWCPRRSGSMPFADQARRYQTLFSMESADTGKWDSARFKMCHRADATIMIGGHARSETTGFLVLASGKLLVPIASFGGAAAALLPAVEQRFLSARPLPAPLTSADLKQFWSDSLLERIGAGIGDSKPKVIVIHGRNTDAARDVVAYIASDLRWTSPQIMLWEYRPGETLPEKWERLANSDNSVAIVVASADDVGRYRNDTALMPRTRQNVWLEFGWFWGKFRGRQNILVLPQTIDDTRLELPSDLSGLEVFEWVNSPLERKDYIRQFLESFRPSHLDARG